LGRGDGPAREAIEKKGVKAFLSDFAGELKSVTYQPRPVKRVYIARLDGRMRLLGSSPLNSSILIFRNNFRIVGGRRGRLPRDFSRFRKTFLRTALNGAESEMDSAR
jgi:hypothetical protein